MVASLEDKIGKYFTELSSLRGASPPGETSLIKDKPSLIFSFWLIKFPLTSGQLSLSIV